VSSNIYELFSARFPVDRSTVFLETIEARRVDFAELEDLTGRYARVLSQHGVAPGERIAVQVETSPENIALYLAALKLGAIYLPLNTAYTDSELTYFLGDARPALLVTRPERMDTAQEIAAKSGVSHVLSLGTKADGTLADKAAGALPLDSIAARAADDIAAILYTSGTTGKPKGAMLSHGNLTANAETLHKLWGFKPDDVLLHALPLFHIHGLFVALNIMLLNGGRIVLMAKFDAAEIVRRLPGVTVLMGVPTFYTRLLAQSGLNADVARKMRLFISGSAPLLAETFDEFARRTGHRILERYGMSETGMNCSNPLNGERRPGTVGPALPGVEVRICDRDGKPLAPGEVGTIEVRGPNVFKGYWGMPEKTASEFRSDGYFITGDLSTIDNEGYITIVGRDKDMIISGGLNVYPKEIEDVLNEMPGIVESAVVGVPHPDFGEVSVAVLVTAKDAAHDETAIINTLTKSLAKFKVPKRVFYAEELPRNTMGKVQKNVLRDRHRELFSAKATA
jgi:malonyl-CoA/methylmalonyl-CoA synthetase